MIPHQEKVVDGDYSLDYHSHPAPPTPETSIIFSVYKSVSRRLE